MPPKAKRPGIVPGRSRDENRWTPGIAPVTPSVQTLMFRSVPRKVGYRDPPSLGASSASGLDWRPRHSRAAIHFTERFLTKAPSRPAMDFARYLWLSCNKPALAACRLTRL